jgi:hypothetical protein
MTYSELTNFNETILQTIFGYKFAPAEKGKDEYGYDIVDRWVPPTRNDPTFAAYDLPSGLSHRLPNMHCYGADLIASWMVVGHLMKSNYQFSIKSDSGFWTASFKKENVSEDAMAKTVSMAICLAALKVVKQTVKMPIEA